MKIKRKPLTPEQQEELDRNWDYMCSLIISDISGKLVNPEEYEQEKRERTERQEQHKRHMEQWENVNSWKQIDFETLNTLIIKYKETNDETYFNQAWDKYLKDLTYSYLNCHGDGVVDNDRNTEYDKMGVKACQEQREKRAAAEFTI